MFQEILLNVNNRAKEFDSNLTRVRVLNEQLISRSEKLLKELDELMEKVKQKDIKKCPICVTRPASRVFVSCGHVVCENCSDRAKQRARCFTCRAPILDIIKVYL